MQWKGEDHARGAAGELHGGAEASPPFWKRLRAFVFGARRASVEEFEQRLCNLTRAIEARPDAAMNYVLRGELLLEAGAYQPAFDDFARALGLASAQVESEDWGLMAQAAQDRAEVGLRNARRLLAKRGLSPAYREPSSRD